MLKSALPIIFVLPSLFCLSAETGIVHRDRCQSGGGQQSRFVGKAPLSEGVGGKGKRGERLPCLLCSPRMLVGPALLISIADDEEKPRSSAGCLFTKWGGPWN